MCVCVCVCAIVTNCVYVFQAPSPSTGPASSPKEVKAGVLPAGQHTHDRYDWLKVPNLRDANGVRKGEPGYDASTLYVPPAVMKKASPAMTQWWEFKAKHFNTVLFFKVGKFYELYHMDADIGVQECDLVYMKGDNAHSGFPEIAYSDKSKMLVEKGYRCVAFVCVCVCGCVCVAVCVCVWLCVWVCVAVWLCVWLCMWRCGWRCVRLRSHRVRCVQSGTRRADPDACHAEGNECCAATGCKEEEGGRT